MLSIIALVISILSLIVSIEMYKLKRLEQRKRILLEMLVDNMLECLDYLYKEEGEKENGRKNNKKNRQKTK